MASLKFNKAELVNLSYSLKREIILANKTGAYCNTSLVTCNTRKYHGLLAVPVEALGKDNKFVLLSALDESLTLRGNRFNLGIHCYGDAYSPLGHKYIVDFDADATPTITYKVGELVLRKGILLSPDEDGVMLRYELLQGPAKVKLSLRPFLAFRSIHDLTHANAKADPTAHVIAGGRAFCLYAGFPQLNLQCSAKAVYKADPHWYENVTYSDEMRRGFDCREDLLVPGEFEVELSQGEPLVVSASVVCDPRPEQLGKKFSKALSDIGTAATPHDWLVRNANLLVTSRGGRKQVNAGFSWLYTGLLRETLEALAGLTLYAKGDAAAFEEILDNLIADNQGRLFRRTTQVEAPLLLPVALQQYIEWGADAGAVWKKYGEVVRKVLESYLPGGREEVGMHPNGLLWARRDGIALSWMNTYVNGRAVTERAGYQVETNALWYNAISFALSMEPGKGAFAGQWKPIQEEILRNFEPTFWNGELRFLADYVDEAGQHMELRPNQLRAAALELRCISDQTVGEIMRLADSELVTRRGIRSLSPRDGRYKGVYEGSQVDRDIAYYNGCAFPSLLGQYCAICFRMSGANFVKRALWLTEGFYDDLSRHGIGAFSELYDGDPPHECHGAVSSALTTAALLHVDWMVERHLKQGQQNANTL